MMGTRSFVPILAVLISLFPAATLAQTIGGTPMPSSPAPMIAPAPSMPTMPGLPSTLPFPPPPQAPVDASVNPLKPPKPLIGPQAPASPSLNDPLEGTTQGGP
jgi:hypothetical protein